MAQVQIPKNVFFRIRPANGGLNYSLPPQSIDMKQSPNLMNVRFSRNQISKRAGFKGKYFGSMEPILWIDVVYSSGGTTLVGFTDRTFYKQNVDILSAMNVWNGAGTATPFGNFSMDPTADLWQVDVGEGKFDFTGRDANGGAPYPTGSQKYADLMFVINPADGLFVVLDSSVGVEAEWIGNLTNGPSTGIAVAVYDNRLVVGGPDDDPTVISWSAQGTLSDWVSAGTGYTVIGDGPDWIQTLKKMGEYLIVYKERSIYIGRKSMVTDPAILFDPAPGQGIGLAAPNSVGDLGEEHIFLGWDDVYVFSLKGIDAVGSRIKDELFYGENGILPEYIQLCTGIIAEEFDEYWLFVPSGKIPEANNVLTNGTLLDLDSDDMPDNWRTDQLIDRGDCESTTPPALTPETTNVLTNCTFAQSSAQKYSGTYSYLFTKTVAAGTEGTASLQANEGTTDMHGLVAGKTYTFMARVYIPSGGILGSEVKLEVSDYDGAWDTTIQVASDTYDSWQLVQVVRTIRATATGVIIRITADSAADDTETFYVDDIRVAEGDGTISKKSGGNFGGTYWDLTFTTGTYTLIQSSKYDFTIGITGDILSFLVWLKSDKATTARLTIRTWDSGETAFEDKYVDIAITTSWAPYIFSASITDLDAQKVQAIIESLTANATLSIDAVQLVDMTLDDIDSTFIYEDPITHYKAPGYIGPNGDVTLIPYIIKNVGPWVTDTVWVYNYEDDAWSAWRIPITGFGYDSMINITRIADLVGLVDEQTWRFDEKLLEALAPTNLIAQPDGQIYEASKLYATDWEGLLNTPVLFFWESKDFDLGNPSVDKTLSRLTIFHESSHPPTVITVGVSTDSAATDWVEQDVTIATGNVQTYADFFVTGSQIRFRVKATTGDVHITGFAVKIIPRGESNAY